MDYLLALQQDDTVPKEKWVATLSNGLVVHENIIRDEPSAWERLTLFCQEKSLHLVGLSLFIANTEIKLPSGQEGYLQKKVAWTNMVQGGIRKCIGYVKGGLALIYEVSSDKDSLVIRGKDPGKPFTIYKSSL